MKGPWSSVEAHQDAGFFAIINDPNKRKTIIRTWKYLRPYSISLSMLVLVIFLLKFSAIAKPLIVRGLIDEGIASGDGKTMAFYCILLVVVPMLNSLLKIAKDELSQHVFDSFSRDMKAAMFSHYQDMSLRFFIDTKKSEIHSRFSTDFQSAQTAILNIISILGDSIQLVSTLFAVFMVDVGLSILIVALFPLFFIPARIYSKHLKYYQDKSSYAVSEYRVFISDILSLDGILLSKIFGLKSFYAKQFDSKHELVKSSQFAYRRRSTAFSTISSLLTSFATALVWWWCGSMVIEGKMKAGMIYNYVSYLELIYSPLSNIINSYVYLLKAVLAFERIFQVLDLPIEIKDSPFAKPLEHIEGAISIQNVSFAHSLQPKMFLKTTERRKGNKNVTASGQHIPDTFDSHRKPNAKDNNSDDTDQDEPTWNLKNVELEIKPRTTVAIVGQSGAGKSTLIHLLVRLMDPSKGSILIDGQDLREVTMESIAQHIALVPQECTLFTGTIRENLQIANLKATEEDMIEACASARILEKIQSLPQQFDAIVGERGHTLSGGERQRLSIARALLRKPKIVILDEATSSLDSINEYLIQRALKKLFTTCTAIVIAHRLSTIKMVDNIVVLDKGEVKEQGTHQELLKIDGYYAKLYKTQFSMQEEDQESILEV